MNVQLKELFDIIGERKTIDYSITADKLSEYGGYSFASPVAVTGEIENRAGVVTLRFKTVFTMDHTCDRCLKEFSREYVYDFEAKQLACPTGLYSGEKCSKRQGRLCGLREQYS